MTVPRTTIALPLAADPGAVTALHLPRGARHLVTFLDYQPGIVLHFEVDDDAEPEVRRFHVVAPTEPVRDFARHVASVQLPTAAGPLAVLHIYELRSNPEHQTEVRLFSEGRAWVDCSCDWRSPLQPSEAAAEALAEDHAVSGQ